MPLFFNYDPDEDSLFYERICDASVNFPYIQRALTEEESAALGELYEAELAGTLKPFELWSDYGKERHFFAFHPGASPAEPIVLFAVFRKTSREEIARLRRMATEY